MSDRILTEADIHQLTELLAEGSHRWEELGIALHLRRHELEECRNNSSNFLRLNSVLTRVVSRGSFTLSQLKTALSSSLVNMNWLVIEISSTFARKEVSAVVDFIVNKEKIERNTARVMVVGFPGGGKSHLLDNLLMKKRRSHYSSTGISDSVVVVDVGMADPTMHTSALGVGSDWNEIESHESLMAQVRNCKNLAKSVASLSESLPSQWSSSHPQMIQNLEDNIRSVLEHNKVESVAMLKSTSSLYFRDTGGQVEFQEILSILINGPSIFFFVMKANLSLDEPLTLEYRDGDRVINCYESTTTTRQALVQTLATIDCTRKPTGIKTHDSVVFIIGTHTDKIEPEHREENIRKLNEDLDNVITTSDKFKDLVVYKDRLTKSVIFPVSNKYPDVKDFKAIRERVNEKIALNRFQIAYSPSYLLFCLELRRYRDSVITLKKCEEIAAKFEIRGKEEMNKLLQFLHHRIGIIQYYNVDGLRHLVIKEPQVLFIKLTELVVNTFPTSEVVNMSDLEKGIVKATVFNDIFKKESEITSDEFIRILKHLRMVASFHDNEELKYFIPAVLNHIPLSTLENKTTSKVCPLAITFECGYCPKGVFGMVVCHFMTKDSHQERSDLSFTLQKDSIYKDLVGFKVDKSKEVCGKIYLKLQLSHIEVRFCPDEEDDEFGVIAPICDKVRQVLGEAVERSLKHLNLDEEKVSPKECFKCHSCGDLHVNEFRKKRVTIRCEKREYLDECFSCWFGQGK